MALRQDIAKLVTNITRVFDGSLSKLPEVVFRSFESMRVKREEPTPIQIDGELIECERDIEVTVSSGGLHVLAPAGEGSSWLDRFGISSFAKATEDTPDQ